MRDWRKEEGWEEDRHRLDYAGIAYLQAAPQLRELLTTLLSRPQPSAREGRAPSPPMFFAPSSGCLTLGHDEARPSKSHKRLGFTEHTMSAWFVAWSNHREKSLGRIKNRGTSRPLFGESLSQPFRESEHFRDPATTQRHLNAAVNVVSRTGNR